MSTSSPASPARPRTGFLRRLGERPWVHRLVGRCGLYEGANLWLRRWPLHRRLPRSGLRYRIRSVAGLALAEELFHNRSYAGVTACGPIRTFLDLGCNAGWFPLVLAEHGGAGDATGILVDADPAMVEEASWHAVTNGLDVESVWAAVGAADGTAGAPPAHATFHVNPANTSSSLAPFGPDHPFPVKGRVRMLRVPCLGLETIWNRRHPADPVDLLKIDVEGAEFALVRHEAPFLAARVRWIVCEWHAWHGTRATIVDSLAAAGFVVHTVAAEDRYGGVVIFRNTAGNVV